MRILKAILNFTGIKYCKHEFEDVPSTYFAECRSENELVEMDCVLEICKHCGIEHCDLSLSDPYHDKKIN